VKKQQGVHSSSDSGDIIMPYQNSWDFSESGHKRGEVRVIRTRQPRMNNVCVFGRELERQLGNNRRAIYPSEYSEPSDSHPVEEVFPRFDRCVAADHGDLMSTPPKLAR